MMATTPRSRRDALVLGAAMSATAAAALLGKATHSVAPAAAAPRIDLASLFPRRFARWQEDAASKAFVRPPELVQGKAYGIYDQVLERTFVNADGERIMLSVAFGGDQSTVFQLHRPEVCYDAGGFAVDQVEAGTLDLPGRVLPVTRLRAVKPFRPEPVTYWTVLGGEAVGGRLAFRLRRIFSGLSAQQNMAGLLVRVSSIDDNTARAFALQGRFAADLARALGPAEQRVVLGRAS